MTPCKSKRYPNEATARRCLWAMTVRGFNTNKMTPKPCKQCNGWHVTRSK